ncbi:MAG: PilN domain-containing protein [Fimbriimonadaceae bacterium]|nr:PilN domain-containing protein [Fimbriimonadaceae bacterium]
MPLVNLIQEQRSAVRARERQTRTVLLGIFGFAAIAFLTAGYFTFETVKYTLKIRELEALKERLTPMMNDLDAKQSEIAGLQVRKNTLTDAETDTARWADFLSYLGANTPDGVVVSDLKSAAGADPNAPVTLNVTGLSVDQKRVGDFILRLESSPQVEGVNLKYTQEKVGPNNQSTQFELSGALEGTSKTPDEGIPQEAPTP